MTVLALIDSGLNTRRYLILNFVPKEGFLETLGSLFSLQLFLSKLFEGPILRLTLEVTHLPQSYSIICLTVRDSEAFGVAKTGSLAYLVTHSGGAIFGFCIVLLMYGEFKIFRRGFSEIPGLESLGFALRKFIFAVTSCPSPSIDII